MTMVADETQKGKKYLRLGDVSKLLNMSKRTIRRLISEHEIPAPILRRGRLMLWRADQFDRWSTKKMEKRG